VEVSVTDVKLKVLIKEGDSCWEFLTDTTLTGMTEDWERGIQLQNTSAVLWDADTSGNMGSFDLLILQSDVAVDVEFTANDGDAAEELFTVRLYPNVPLILGADDSYYGHAASDAFGGTGLDVIDRIRFDEPNNVLATVSMRAWKV
jgi:hypothetical protein